MNRCAACPREIPPGAVWCSWSCRSVDDPHDDLDYLTDSDTWGDD